jgi:hypothetical protein
MTEEAKKERTLEDIKSEHNQCCFEVGFLQYRRLCDLEEIEKKNMKLKELNLEAADLQKKQGEEKNGQNSN